MTSNQAVYLGIEKPVNGQEKHNAILLNCQFELLNPATGQPGRRTGHAHIQFYPAPFPTTAPTGKWPLSILERQLARLQLEFQQHQIGVTMKDAQVVLEVSDSSAEGVGTQDPRRPRPDTPCLPFVLMTEKPVLAEPNNEISATAKNEPQNRSEEDECIVGPKIEDQHPKEAHLHISTQPVQLFLARSPGSETTSNEESLFKELFSMEISPAQSLSSASVHEEKPSDILDAALLRIAARENRFSRPPSTRSSDEVLDDIPELETPSSSEPMSRSPSPALATCGSDSLLMKESYILIPTIDIVREAGELRRYAPTPDWIGTYVGIVDYVTRKQDGAQRKEAWEDNMTARLGTKLSPHSVIVFGICWIIVLWRERRSSTPRHPARTEEAHDARGQAATESMAILFIPKRDQFHVTEHELNLVTSYAGTGTRQMPADFAVPAQGPARLAATAIEFLLRGTQCTELTRTRIVLLEFIEQSFTLICRRHFNIDISDMHTQSPPPLPFLDGEENAKLRLVRHTFEKNGDGRIAQIAKKILEFQFTEPQPPTIKSSCYHTGGVAPGPTSGTVAYTLNVGSMRWTGKIILLPRIIAVLPLLWDSLPN
ncbi:hypothetical protein K438DRAFT_1766404 [Mycena galopus ATCC 62051]|nr:hypothetical protein K438DRAFT_1766404 [Mycena galopus ATCC 62051]